MSSFPTLILIPGSFAPASSLEKLRAALEVEGISAEITPLPSSNPKDAATATCAADAEHVQKTHIQPLLDQGKRVIVFGHSYGGLIAGAAARGLKRKGPGTVVGLILHSAMFPPERVSMEALFGGQLPPFILQDQVCASMFCSCEFSAHMLLIQPSPGLSVNANNPEFPHATAAFKSPAPKGAWTEDVFADHLVYIRTTKDKERFTSDIQDNVMKGSGAEWTVEDVYGTHEAYNTHTNDVVSIIKKYAVQWDY